LVARAPAPLWEVRRNAQGQITELRRTEQWPYVQHYYFQILDREWGHVVVRLCGYAPWGAQVIVNGHEWVERQARAQKVRVVKKGNCFIEGTHYQAVDRLASGLSGPDLGPRLAALCARWLYSASNWSACRGCWSAFWPAGRPHTWRFWTRGSLSAGPNRASAGTDDWRAWI
jgi:hypothetical protein